MAQRMGHAEPNMTLRVYGHLAEGVQEELTAKLDDLRATTEPTGRKQIGMPPPAVRRGLSRGSRGIRPW